VKRLAKQTIAIFFSQIIYFLACNKDTILAP